MKRLAPDWLPAVVRALLDLRVVFALLGLLLLAIIWNATLYTIDLDGRNAEQAASESTLEVIDTYQAQMAANLHVIDQTLKTVKYAFELRRTGPDALIELREKGLLPPGGIFCVGLTDAEGNIIASTRPNTYAGVAQRSWFLSHRAPGGRGTQVTTVHLADGAHLLFSRRLDAPDGGFDGVAVVMVAAEFFTSGYETARIGAQGMLALLGEDGALITARLGDTVWHDAALKIDLKAYERASDALPQAVPSQLDGRRRFTEVRHLFGYPLIILAGLSEDEQLAGFQERRSKHLWQAGLASVVLGAFLLTLGGLSWQLVATRLRTRKEQETYYAASNASRDGLFILKPVRDGQRKIIDFAISDANVRGMELFGTSKSDIAGKLLCEVLPHARHNGTLEEFVRVAETGVAAELEWENTIPRLRARWLYRQVLRVEGDLVVMMRDISERKKAERQRAEQARVLEIIAKGAPLEDVLDRLMHLIESQFDQVQCSVLLLEQTSRQLRHAAALGLDETFLRAIDGIAIGPKVGSCGTAAWTGKPVLVADIEQDPLWDGHRELALAHGLRSCWSFPVLSQRETVLGTFALYTPVPGLPTPTQMQQVEIAARMAGIAIERKLAEDRIRHMAQHDSLTGLPNRILLEDRLRQAIRDAERKGRGVTVLFLDLDRFKVVNDSLGHSVGDELLKAIAQRMLRSVRTSDTVVRVGGDEFVVVLVDQPRRSDAALCTVEKLLATIGEPLMLAGRELQVSASIGLAAYPEDGETPDRLLANADAAMYRAKELGRNTYQFFTAELNARVRHTLELQEGLRNALARHELVLHYQPQVDMRSGRMVGVEALVRWQHPQRGLLSPSEFIPVAEESGMIVAIGQRVLEEACRQNKAWQDAGLPPLVIAVNVSARQFRDAEFPAKVRRALQDSGLAPCWLELELTESLIMQDMQQAVSVMRELKAMGVQLSIDDFGTGYSNLSALKRFPIARLKLDKSFVRDLPTSRDDSEIARAIISLGHTLNLRVLAEGVENVAQFAFLQRNGCDEAQGYYVCRPGSAEQIAEVLADRSGSVHAELE